jgi:hypothetical protein
MSCILDYVKDKGLGVANVTKLLPVLTDSSPSLPALASYGRRFGGIEPHFKDYKSVGFTQVRSHLRGTQAPTPVLIMLAGL